MLVLEHMKQIVAACYPATEEAALAYWHDIKPVKFGHRISWGGAGEHILAQYQIPEDASYLVVLRTEVYVDSTVVTAPDFQMHGTPPPDQLGTRWRYQTILGTAQYNQTALVPIHLLCDCDEMLIFKSGNFIELIADIAANPSADARLIRTLVYGYNIGALVADRIGGGESTQFGSLF